MNYSENLKKGKSKIAVWGTGYIGLSTMAFFSKKNITCVGYDVDKAKVKTINSGKLPIKELKEWFGFNIKKAVKKKHKKRRKIFISKFNMFEARNWNFTNAN